MDGILIVYKPSGCTSHDVVQIVRRRFGLRRVGHTGTLDPLAEGVMVLLLGRMTRLSEFITAHQKVYQAGLLLGLRTDTEDVEGRILTEVSASEITSTDILDALPSFRGVITQIPPMYSAVKVNGERLYRLARQGKTVERAARTVEIQELEMLSFQPGERARATLNCAVSAGCYIRTLCADIGEKLGVGGCMEWLVRTSVGPFGVDEAAPLEEIQRWSSNDLKANICPPAAALEGIPRVDVDSVSAKQFCCGIALPSGQSQEGLVRVHDEGGELLGIGQVQEDSHRIRPLKVLCANG